MYPIGDICKVTDPSARRLILHLYQTVEKLQTELEESKSRKGVPSQLIELSNRTKPPNIIA